MKKITLIALVIVMSTMLSACSYKDDNKEDIIDKEIDVILNEKAEELALILPQTINHSYVLPGFDDVTVKWALNEESIAHILEYNNPFLHEDHSLKATLGYEGFEKTFTFDVRFLAADTAIHNYKVYLEMDGTIHDLMRHTYQSASIRVYGSQNDQFGLLFESYDLDIRGRGNSTWGMPKKPIRLKFDAQETIIGLPHARNYVLLAEYADKSLIRNTVVHRFTQLLNPIEHSVSTRSVELYFNGLYQGVYVLTEQIELAPSKLSVNTNPQEEEFGFFLEMDQRFYEKGGVDGEDWVVLHGVPYEINDPDPHKDDYDYQTTEAIRAYLQAVEHALETKTNYADLIDVDSFIDYFLVQELFKNVDVGWSSVYMYRHQGGKLHMGPLWDFDLAIGNADYIDYGPENWYGMRDGKNRWFKLMMDIPEIREQFRNRFFELSSKELPLLLESIDMLERDLENAAARNFAHWDRLGHYDWPNPPEVVNANTHSKQVQVVKEYIEARITWIEEALLTQAYNQGIFD